MKLTFLGTGTSQGVPVIGCKCSVCTSQDSRDNRLRTSAMVEVEGLRLIIDAGPDFRMQMLRSGVRQIDGILLTHEHKDHTGGIDDVRALNYVDFPTLRPVDIYGTKHTLKCVKADYKYAFAENPYRGVPLLELKEIDQENNFKIGNITITPIKGGHSEFFNVTGFRIEKMAYLTDFKTIEPSEIEKLKGVEVLVVNALRYEIHTSHFSISEALELIQLVAPQRAYFTHMSHDVGLHADLAYSLPGGVEPAYDGLEVEI